jgi:hypothetical protein
MIETTELTPEQVAARVRPYVLAHSVGNITLDIDATRIHLRNGYWRIPIRPSQWPDPLFPYYEELANMEEEIQEKEHISVTLASGEPHEQ